jgi:hypothetical protein
METIINFFGSISPSWWSIIGGVGGVLIYRLYLLVKSLYNPVEYLADLYSLADRLVLELDNRFIDRFLTKDAKEIVQRDIISVLTSRKASIDNLIDKIVD